MPTVTCSIPGSTDISTKCEQYPSPSSFTRQVESIDAPTPHAKQPRVTFFHLPGEIRNQIYLLVLGSSASRDFDSVPSSYVLLGCTANHDFGSVTSSYVLLEVTMYDRKSSWVYFTNGWSSINELNGKFDRIQRKWIARFVGSAQFDTALLRTNRAISAEATSYLYSQHLFSFSLGTVCKNEGSDDSFRWNHLTKIGIIAMQSIRRCSITVFLDLRWLNDADQSTDLALVQSWILQLCSIWKSHCSLKQLEVTLNLPASRVINETDPLLLRNQQVLDPFARLRGIHRVIIRGDVGPNYAKSLTDVMTASDQFDPFLSEEQWTAENLSPVDRGKAADDVAVDTIVVQRPKLNLWKRAIVGCLRRA